MTTHLLWLRNDLRLHDHEALIAALEGADRLIAVYCFDPRHFGETRWGFAKTGALRAQFLIESLADLRASMRSRGSELIVRRGKPEDVIPALVAEHDVAAVFAHDEPMSEEMAVSNAVDRAVPERIPITYFWGHTLYHLDDLPMDAAKKLPQVFSKFRREVEKRSSVRSPYDAPDTLPPPPDGPDGKPIDAGTLPSVADLGLTPYAQDERTAIVMRGGETEGLARLDQYFWKQDLLKVYKETRNGLLGADYSSKFSPWLAHGCLSPRRIHAEVDAYEAQRVANKSTYWLIFELIWRDYFRFYGVFHDDALFHPSGPDGADIDWERDRAAFDRWADGETGFPFIDANMRELNLTGFMSNRGRQNVASFLTKNLNLDWRWGASYFESRLVDYDVTSNWGNWAYNAGVGADPRDRYFNILSQGDRYDGRGDYVRHWLPELANLRGFDAHKPWTLPKGILRKAGIELGDNYPAPMIDLEASYEQVRQDRRKKGAAMR
ncbi:MAG: DASH family cryptochrome [Bacteroidota bacterium]